MGGSYEPAPHRRERQHQLHQREHEQQRTPEERVEHQQRERDGAIEHQAGAPPVQRLVTELGRLPGIGQRTAQRLAFHILRASPEEATS